MSLLVVMVYCCHVEAAIFICQIIGPLGGGFWAVYGGFVAPMLFAVIAVLLAFIWILNMPESLPADAPSRLMPVQYSPWSTMSNLFSLFSVRPVSGTSVVPFILLGFASFFWPQLSNAIIFPLFAKHVFHWDSDMIGIALSIQGLVIIVSMLGSRTLFLKLTGYQLHPIVWIFIGIIGW
jgi:hypothetical protein